MTDFPQEGKLQAEISNGHEARTILEHPMFVAAFAKVRERINKEFEACAPDDMDKLLRCKLTLDVLRCIQYELTETKRKGEDAQREMGRIEKWRERLKLKGWIDH